MKITALKVQKRNPARVNVYLDGRYAFSLVAVEAARLRVGQQLDQAARDGLQAADQVERAYARALSFLTVRPRSEAEVRRRLREHQVDEATASAVLARLRRAGLVDDQAFASYWVENRAAFRPKSKRLLQSELKAKGVADEVLGAALQDVDEAEAAYRLAAARARSARLRALPYRDFRRRLGEYLGRRGFDYDLIASVVERVWSDTRPSEADPPA